MGDIVPVPAGARAGWNTDIHRYEAANPPLLPRERNQVLVFYMDDDAKFWDHVGGAPAVAFPWNGTTSFNRRTMGLWWNDRDDSVSTLERERTRRTGDRPRRAPSPGFQTPDSADRHGVLMAWAAPWPPGFPDRVCTT